jgi:hypothetical protein
MKILDYSFLCLLHVRSLYQVIFWVGKGDEEEENKERNPQGIR